MSKNVCPACNAEKFGYRSKTPYKHTCGQEPEAAKPEGDRVLTFEEIKDSFINNQRLNFRQKLELLPIDNMKDLVAKIKEYKEYDPHQI